jgi:hypothetical protein
MKQIVVDQNKLIADFFVNIGVAWFTAGVIGVFINKGLTQIEILYSVGWGVGFASLSLLLAVVIIKGRKNKKR